jgi:hypothetical protein
VVGGVRGGLVRVKVREEEGLKILKVRVRIGLVLTI